MTKINWPLLLIIVVIALMLVQLAQPHTDVPQHRRLLTPNGL